MDPEFILVMMAGLLWMIIPPGFAVAFFLWWRRRRHWSLAVLAAAWALFVAAQFCGWLIWNIFRFGKTPEEVAHTPELPIPPQAVVALDLMIGIMLLLGILGLISMARNDSPLEPAEKRSQSSD